MSADVLTCNSHHPQKSCLGSEDGNNTSALGVMRGWEWGCNLRMAVVSPSCSFLAGTLPKPVLRAQPHSVVSKQNKVTFLCEGATGAKEYRFYKELYQDPWQRLISQNPKNKNEFSISNLDYHHAGQYRCQYRTLNGWSEYSDSLELVVTGERTVCSVSISTPSQPGNIMRLSTIFN